MHVPLCQQKSMGAMAEGDTDEFKRVLLEGNPFFLGLTFCVSMLHSVSLFRTAIL
jgi:Cleft lip and palate transmembrane protein 1 (CLPTM1)